MRDSGRLQCSAWIRRNSFSIRAIREIRGQKLFLVLFLRIRPILRSIQSPSSIPWRKQRFTRDPPSDPRRDRFSYCLTRTTKATCSPCLFSWAVFGPKTGPFCRKTVVPRKLFCTFFRVFSIFRDFFRCNPLFLSNKRRSNPSQKNRAKNTTVGFLSGPDCAIIAA